jgi:ABC-type transporter MlaC component
VRVACFVTKANKTMKPVDSVELQVSKNKQYAKVLRSHSTRETKVLARSKKIDALVQGRDFKTAQEAEISALADAFITNAEKRKKRK